MSTVMLNTNDDQDVEIPLGVDTLTEFRRWVFSKRFPERGRIDYIRGTIEVDMAADDLFVNNLPKTELISVIVPLVKNRKLGWFFADGARISCPSADLSVEPDSSFVSFDAVESKRVRFRRSKSKSHQGWLEIVGPPDLVIEMVSDSSVRKDTKLLPRSYYAAGVREFWLFDCRGDQLQFDMMTRGRGGFRGVQPDSNGFRHSDVLGASFRLLRKQLRPPTWDYTLEVR